VRYSGIFSPDLQPHISLLPVPGGSPVKRPRRAFFAKIVRGAERRKLLLLKIVLHGFLILGPWSLFRSPSNTSVASVSFNSQDPFFSVMMGVSKSDMRLHEATSLCTPDDRFGRRSRQPSPAQPFSTPGCANTANVIAQTDGNGCNLGLPRSARPPFKFASILEVPAFLVLRTSDYQGCFLIFSLARPFWAEAFGSSRPCNSKSEHTTTSLAKPLPREPKPPHATPAAFLARKSRNHKERGCARAPCRHAATRG